jgi:cytochrome d ubiquinol oxidase subunit I
MHVVSALMVAVGSTMSAFWIIVANSWQQTPAGYRIVDGRAELTSFFDAVFNPSAMPRFLHTLDAALVTGSFFMMGLSAHYLLRGRHLEFAKRSFRLALVVAFIGSLAQIGLGHTHAVQVAETQPAKLAAFEALFETQRNAPLILFGLVDEERGRVSHSIEIPGALSFLVGNSFETEVQGLDAFPRDEWPPVVLSGFAFHVMFVLGLFFAGFTAAGVLLLWRRRLFDEKSLLGRWYLRIAVLSIPLPFITNELGWIAAEVGRQPWAVWHMLRTRDAVSVTVPAEHLLASIVMFGLIYALLFWAWIFLLRRKVRSGPEQAPATAAPTEEVAT